MDDAVAAKLRYLATQISHLKEKSKEVESNKLDTRQAVWRKPDQLNTFFHVRMKKTPTAIRPVVYIKLTLPLFIWRKTLTAAAIKWLQSRLVFE